MTPSTVQSLLFAACLLTTTGCRIQANSEGASPHHSVNLCDYAELSTKQAARYAYVDEADVLTLVEAGGAPECWNAVVVLSTTASEAALLKLIREVRRQFDPSRSIYTTQLLPRTILLLGHNLHVRAGAADRALDLLARLSTPEAWSADYATSDRTTRIYAERAAGYCVVALGWSGRPRALRILESLRGDPSYSAKFKFAAIAMALNTAIWNCSRAIAETGAAR